MKKLFSILAAIGVIAMFTASNAQAGGIGGHSYNSASSYSKMLRHKRHGYKQRHHRGKKVVYKKVVKTKYKHGKKIIIVKIIKKVKPRRHGKRFVFKGNKQTRRCRPSSYKFVKHHKRPKHNKPKGCHSCGGNNIPQNNVSRRGGKKFGVGMTQNRRPQGGISRRGRRS